MSRQNYVEFARILRESKASELTVTMFAVYLKQDNPRFDVDRFRRACAWAA